MLPFVGNALTKLGNVFDTPHSFWGIATQISPKQSFYPTISSLDLKFCSL